MNSWTGDVSESNGDDDEDAGFAAALQAHVDDGVVGDIDELELVKGIDDVNDKQLLAQAHAQLEGNGHDEHLNIIEKRLDALGAGLKADDDGDESEDPSEDEDFGGTSVEDADELEETEAEEPVVESVEEMADESGTLGGEADESASSDLSVETDGVPQPEGAVSVEQAAERERRWKTLVWGPPGLFKSHFAYTAPEPIAYIDTERKADDIAHKFADKEIQIWQPEDFRETQNALSEALDWLEWWKENEGELGTIVVDSMSVVWEWAKTAYKTEAYPMTDNEDVTLSSNMGSSKDSDWQHIKGMHNSEFRQWMTDSPFHFVWTAGETEDYNAVMSGDSDGATPMKAEGEKNNTHKADSIIRARYDDDGNKVGDLVKSNFTDRKFLGLERPTFPKLRDTVQGIEDAEASDEAVDKADLEKELGVTIVKTDPQKNDN